MKEFNDVLPQATLFQSLKTGSLAQLSGELTEDFTTQSRAQVLEFLKGLRDSNASRDDELLHCLLVSADAGIVLLAVEAIAAGGSSRKRGFDDEKKLVLVEELSRGWPGKEKCLELATCISGSDDEEVTRLASSLYFEFYHNASLRVIDVAMEQLQSEDSLGLFNRLIREFDVPAEFRFALLTRIRFAKAFPLEEDRGIYVRILILAMGLEGQEREIVDKMAEIALKDDAPEGIRLSALTALTAQGRLDVDHGVGSKVEAFLNGQSQHSEEFIKALVLNTTRSIQFPTSLSFHQVPAYIRKLASSWETLRWLEDELKDIAGDQDQPKCQVIKSLILVLKQTAFRSSVLDQCLMKIFENFASFDMEVFDAAAALAVNLNSGAEVQGAFMDAMILEVIPSRWKVLDSTIGKFFAKISSNTVISTVSFIVSNVGAVADEVLLSALRSNHLPALIEAGRYNFLQQLPLSVISRLGKREPALDGVSKAKYADIVKNLNRAFVFVPGQEEKCAELLEVHARILQWLLSDYTGNCNRVLLEQLQAQKFLEKLVPAFEALGRWSITVHGGMALSLDAYLSIFKQLINSTDAETQTIQQIFHAVFPVLRHCSLDQITPTVAAVATELFQKACPPNVVDGSAVSAMVSMGYSTNLARTALEKTRNDIGRSIDEIAKMESDMEVDEQIQLPPMSEMTDLLLKLAGCSGCRDWILAIWRNGDHNESLVGLIHEVCSGCVPAAAEAAAAAARLFVVLLHEEKVARLARGSGLIPRICEMVSSGFGPSTTELLLALDRLFDNDLFETISEVSEEERKGALLWFGDVVKSGRHYGSELLKLGVTLTRHCRNSAELVAAGDLNALLSKILELGDFDSASKSYAFQIVLQLLEDHHMLYQRIVQSVQKAMPNGRECDARSFLSKLSDLAYRDPALFLQAAFETSEVFSADGKQYVTLKSDKASTTQLSGRFLDSFGQLIAVFLARSDEVAMELFMKIFGMFPLCVNIVVRHDQGRVLDRVLESNCSEEDSIASRLIRHKFLWKKLEVRK